MVSNSPPSAAAVGPSAAPRRNYRAIV